MLCDYCQKNEATNILKQTVNGSSKVLHICDSCANSMLFSNLFSDFSIHNIFTKGLQAERPKKICPHCTTALDDIMSSGKVGCSGCYEVFAAELSRSIEKIHGKSSHVGKIPQSAAGRLKLKSQLTERKMELNRLIAEQKFEEAAVVRDEIKKLEHIQDENGGTADE